MRAAYQRSYFAPALFSLIPVATDLIDSMAVDAQWRLYYNDVWVARHTVEENATLLIHEVGHLLRDHEARRRPPASRIIGAGTLPATARSMTISTPRACRCQAIRRYPPKCGLESGATAEVYYKQLPAPPRADRRQRLVSGHAGQDCGSGAHGERRFWELPADDEREEGHLVSTA